MTRAIIMAITLIAVTLLIISAFQKDENLPEPTTTIEVEDQHQYFEETIEIPAETPEDQPNIRKGTYEFKIDKSVFRFDMEYNLITEKFQIKNMSDVVSQLTTITTEVPYRVYHNNRFSAGKLWGSSLSHFYHSGYGRRVFKSFWLNFSGGLYISPKEISVMVGIGFDYEW